MLLMKYQIEKKLKLDSVMVASLETVFLNIKNNKYILTLKENERAIAQGQAAVLYIGTQCIGGGTVISKCLNQN